MKVEIANNEYLRKIPIKECDENFIDIKDVIPNIKIQIADYITDKKEQQLAKYVRGTVAHMLKSAIDELPDGYTLLLRCGYRSPKTQQKRYEEIENNIRADHPGFNEKQIQRKLDERIAPVDLAPHCTGGAIDIFPVTNNGRLVDIECSPGEFTERTYTYSDKISERARQKRKIFIDALTKSGFSNFPAEIWHWSYGESDWVAYSKKKYAIYGPKEFDLKD
ncbi:M15 family metallopeptidase [bacterium]|nr:M15 family metallopeptidase [bacterium]